jgi:uncharacterized protein (DUF1330 family)
MKLPAQARWRLTYVALGVLIASASVFLRPVSTLAQSEEKRDDKPGYAVFLLKVTDQNSYKRYTELVISTLQPYHGRVISAVGRDGMQQVEGGSALDRAAILEFPSFEAAQNWYHSPAYQDAMAFRTKAGESQVILLRGR